MAKQLCHTKVNLILRDAEQKIREFNRIGLHYNLVAKSVYKRRMCEDPFGNSFMQYIIAGLISFDMGRMMGKVEKAYDFEGKGFGSRLSSKLREVRPILGQLMGSSLTEIDLEQHKDAILKAYKILSDKGKGALYEGSKKHFYVGATKILHFLNPELFIIVDSYADKAFREVDSVKFRGGTRQEYLDCISFAQQDIRKYGLKQFKALEPGTPITRIYDKLTFMTGKYLSRDEGTLSA